MDSHTAKVFVKDVIFDLVMTTVPFHLWSAITLSGAGVETQSFNDLAEHLGISPEAIAPNMNLKQLADVVAETSCHEVRVVRTYFFF